MLRRSDASYVRARVDGVDLSKRVACAAAVRALPSPLRFFCFMQGGLAACKTLASF